MRATLEQLTGTTEEDAYGFTSKLIHDHMKLNRQSELGGNGVDIAIEKLVGAYVPSNGTYNPVAIPPADKQVVYKAFYGALWQMCLQGLIRPSAACDPHVNNVFYGAGYSFTERGLDWFKKGDFDAMVMSGGRLSSLLSQYQSRFGDAYAQRVREAITCYQARAFLACCVMVGAAAESIMLELAITKDGGKTDVIGEYSKAGGRTKIEHMVMLGHKSGKLIAHLSSGFELLKAWRDRSAHGTLADFGEPEALTAMNKLHRFAQLSDEKWTEITSP